MAPVVTEFARAHRRWLAGFVLGFAAGSLLGEAVLAPLADTLAALIRFKVTEFRLTDD